MPRHVQPARARPARRTVIQVPADRLDDPREQQKWFLRLPEHAKQDLRARWRAAEGRTASGKRRRSGTFYRYVFESAGVFAVAQLVFFGAMAALQGAVYGALAGAAAAKLRAGTFLYGFIGAAAYGIYAGSTPWGHFLGFIFYIGLCAMLGLVHVLQRADGTEC